MPTMTVERILRGRRSQPHQLIEVLQDIQEENGYISQKDMTNVSRELGVPLIEVYRVASFYKAFRLKPTGKYILTMCQGTACHVRNSELLLDQATDLLGVQPGEITMDGLFSIECVNCLGTCAMGPVVKVNEVYYGHMTADKLRRAVEAIRRRELGVKKNV